MAAADLKTFIELLAAYMAATASIAFPSTANPGARSALWIYELIEADSTLVAASPSPASVIVPYDGMTPYVPVAKPSLQIKTIGVKGDDSGAMARAVALQGTLQNASRVPLRMFNLPTSGTAQFRINAITNLRGPWQIGRDDKGRIEIVSNCDLEYVPLS